MANKFIGLEDEISIRRAVRQAYKHEGRNGIFKCIGEASDWLHIVLEVSQDILDEEAAKGR